MQLPEELQTAIDSLLQNASTSALQKARAILTQTYRGGSDSRTIFNDESRRLAYLAVRMPATFAAVYKVLQSFPFSGSRLLDLGAGPGTASWAAASLFPDLRQISLVERSPDAIALGKNLARGVPILERAEWIQRSLADPLPLPESDLAVLSYVLNEMENPEELWARCWNAPIRTIAVIEPGTPKGFGLIRRLRQKAIEWGAHIASPCPHGLACPIQGSDWCHFSARIERSRLHRQLKEGSLGYEDEKFSYLVVSKDPLPHAENRIVRHPMKGSGHVRLNLCTKEGSLAERVVTRSDKESYRNARDAEWGSPWM